MAAFAFVVALLAGISSLGFFVLHRHTRDHLATKNVTSRAIVPTELEPGGGHTLFPGRRIVAYYGEAGNPSLGVLGDASPEQLWPRLAKIAANYQQPRVPVLPAFELIADVAQSSPGADGSYAVRVPNLTIASYYRVVAEHHGLLILDIQPGRGSFLADAKSLSYWLSKPDVALALDPEWQLQPGELPLEQIGHTTSKEVDEVASWLTTLVQSHHLPQKLLLVHEFTPAMVQGPTPVASRSHIAIVMNIDGFGARANKLATYSELAGHGSFYVGFKLFFHSDIDMFQPNEILRLRPSPNVIEYE